MEGFDSTSPGRVKLTGVGHHVHAALWEDGRLARLKIGRHEFGAILCVHVRGSVALNGDDEVGGARVPMGWEHSAGPEVEHGDCGVVSLRLKQLASK